MVQHGKLDPVYQLTCLPVNDPLTAPACKHNYMGWHSQPNEMRTGIMRAKNKEYEEKQQQQQQRMPNGINTIQIFSEVSILFDLIAILLN